MIVREVELLGGRDHKVEIILHHSEGDRSRMFERNKSHEDVPLVIAYNLGKDFPFRTDEEKKQRVIAFIKMLRVGLNEVMQDVGSLVGAQPPPLPPEGIVFPGRGKQ